MTKTFELAIIAALAPKEIAEWHSATYPRPRPERPPGAEWCDGCKCGADCEDPAGKCAIMNDWKDRTIAWTMDRDKFLEMTWRLAWAESILYAAEKTAQKTPL